MAPPEEQEQSGIQRLFGKAKQWIGWSWTYLWGFWFLLVIFLLYVLRAPLRLKENMNLGKLNVVSAWPDVMRRLFFFDRKPVILTGSRQLVITM